VKLKLKAPVTRGSVPLEQVLSSRRSERSYSPDPLPPDELGQLAWAAQGISDPRQGLRTAPSAGALYPLELYFVTERGVLHYLPESHAFERRAGGDLRLALSRAALGQEAVHEAACDVVITSVTSRLRGKYGDRAPRYAALEAGHAAQNLLLEATARGLASVPVGAFDDRSVSELLRLPSGEEPLYLVAVGYPAGARMKADE
jgi:SagB-type dehydrogenase family enzyme